MTRCPLCRTEHDTTACPTPAVYVSPVTSTETAPVLRMARVVADLSANVFGWRDERCEVARELIRDLEAAPDRNVLPSPAPERRTITRTQYEWAVTHAANWTQMPANVLVQDLLAAWRLTVEDA